MALLHSPRSRCIVILNRIPPLDQFLLFLLLRFNLRLPLSLHCVPRLLRHLHIIADLLESFGRHFFLAHEFFEGGIDASTEAMLDVVASAFGIDFGVAVGIGIDNIGRGGGSGGGSEGFKGCGGGFMAP